MCMCFECAAMSRRGVLSRAVAGAAAGFLALAPGRAFAKTTTTTPDQALEKLQAGNKRFLAEPQACQVGLAQNRSAVANAQSPWATILTCSDSRVPPEIIFGGLDLGEIFVARNAGNIADEDVMGTIEYGAEHLGSPLVVVMGHKRCGAVSAACDVVAKGTELHGALALMIAKITPAAKSQLGKSGDFVDNAVRENARLNAEKIADNEIVGGLVREGKVKVVYARYDLDSGIVDFLG